ncbi:MAG: hypothetical protein Aurels2KO_50490 [Aureliella sp.]
MTLGKLIAKARPRKDRKNRSVRKQQTQRRRLGQSVERLEARQLLAADLDFSTFFPSTPMEEGVAAIAQDSAGNAYVADYRYDASTFEVSSKLSKITPDGTVLWTQVTDAYAYDVGIDDAGLIYLATLTTDAGLPVTSDAYQADLAGDSDFYVMVIDGNAVDSDPSTLSTDELVYASYLGGTGSENSAYLKLAVDSAGGFAIAAESSSSDFPVTSQPGVDTTLNGGSDGVIAYFAPDMGGGYSLELSTYLGGGEADRISGIAIDDSGIIHAVGRTRSDDFPLSANPIQATKPGVGLSGFVTRLTTNGDVTFSTYLGSYQASEVTVDAAGNSYVVGRSWKDGTPVTPGTFAPDEVFGEAGSSLPGSFVSKIDTVGELEASSWFQFSQDVLYATQPTISLQGDRPVISGYDDRGPDRSSFFFRFDADLTMILDYVEVESVSDLLAGPPAIFSSEVIDGSLYIGGYTTAANFATTADAIHPTKNIGADGFVRKYTFAEPLPVFDTLDDFDNGTPDGGTGAWIGAWQLGSNTSFTTGSGPNDGSTHAIIQRGGSLTRQVDVSGVSDLQLSFASKLRSFENSDRAYVRVSPDGSNWTTLKTFVNGEDDDTYREYSYDIPFESDTLWIKFDGDMSSSRWDYWYVDTVAVTGVIASQPPAASDDSGSGAEDQAVTIDVLANDSDPEGDALSIASVTQPTSGSAAILNGRVQYTPNANFNGSDSFTYTVVDPSGNSATASVMVNITPVNDAPIGGDDSVTTLEDTPVTFSVLGNDSDIDGDVLSVSSATDGTNGTVTINADDTLTYTPAAGYFGNDQFTYTISDGNGGSDTASVLVTVEEQNDSPVAVGDSASTDEDLTLLIDVLANDSDPDGDTLSLQSVSAPTSGSAAIVNGKIEYTPAADFGGSDSFAYTIVDTAGNTATATVDVTVTPVNDAPVASGESYSHDQDSTLTIDAPGVLVNDLDIDGDALTASLIAGPDSGSLTLNADGSFAFTPDAGFVGSDSFRYQAVDTSGAVSLPVTVSLQVNAVVSGPNLSHGNVSSVASSWQTVSLGKSYTSAVIVATPQYSTGSGPGVVRISNVTATSFDVRVDDAGATPFSGGVHFIAMEEGVYHEDGEYTLEAVKVDASTTSGKTGGWQIGSQRYQQEYTNPVIVGQVMSTNDEDWSVFWSSSSSRTSPATSGSLNVGKHVGEDSDTTRATETLGYFVIESTGSGTIDGLAFTAGVGSDTIRGVGNGTYQYSNVTPTGATTAVLSTAGMDGGDGGWAALMGSGALPAGGGSIALSIDEDQIRDSERNHTTEQVGYFVIGGPTGEGESTANAAPPITVHDPLDVNGDGHTSPIDALQVINSLNAEAPMEEGDMALDTNGDGHISPIDALLVINRLNAIAESSNDSDTTTDAIDGYFGDLDDDEEESIFGLRFA